MDKYKKEYIPKVMLKDISITTINPPQRSNKTQIKNLTNSVKNIGNIYPVVLIPSNSVPTILVKGVVTEKYTLLDGHRRVQALKENKIKYIDALLLTTDNSDFYFDIFGVIQNNSKPFSGWDSLYTFIKSGKKGSSIKTPHFNNNKSIIKDMGFNFLNELLNAGINPGGLIKLYSEYKITLKDDTLEFKKSFLKCI